MPNPFHLVVEPPRGNLVPGMKWLLGTYTSRYSGRYGYFGEVRRREWRSGPAKAAHDEAAAAAALARGLARSMPLLRSLNMGLFGCLTVADRSISPLSRAD